MQLTSFEKQEEILSKGNFMTFVICDYLKKKFLEIITEGQMMVNTIEDVIGIKLC